MNTTGRFQLYQMMSNNCMPIMSSLKREIDGIWYFAYGSNMVSAILKGQRKISPLRAVPAKIDDHVLKFSLLGVPYNEPAMANLEPLSVIHGKVKPIAAHGVAFLISPQDFTQIIASEGGGITYRSTRVRATALDQPGNYVDAHTLVAKKPATLPRLPSERYKALLIEGARSHKLPFEYQQMLADQKAFKPGHSSRFAVGKRIFDVFWVSFAQKQIQQGVVKFRNKRGTVPHWFMLFFDFMYSAMWIYHDYFHSRLWARGDGL